MSKFLYRLWFPMVGRHGSDFNKFCEKCQDEIERILEEDGFVVPTTIELDTSIGISIRFGFSFKTFEPCEDCQKELKDFFESADFLKFGTEKNIELWRNRKEESE